MSGGSEKIERIAEEVAEVGIGRVGLAPCRYYLSTGCTILDLAISGRYPGGVGGGRVSHFYGDASTAKSVIVQQILGAAQRAGGYAILEDAEQTFDFDRAKLFGLDVDGWTGLEDEDKKLEEAIKRSSKFCYRLPLSIEQLYDEEIGQAIELIEKGKLPHNTVIGIDSVSALPSKEEQEGGVEGAGYGTSRAKVFSRAFRKYIGRMASCGLTVILIDQIREKIGVMFGKKHAVSGGKAKDFYASTQVLLTNRGKIKNKYGQVIGVEIGFEVEKNKIYVPFLSGQFRLLFDIGIDDVGTNLVWLRENAEYLPDFVEEKEAIQQEYLEKINALRAEGKTGIRQLQREMEEKIRELKASSVGGKEWRFKDLTAKSLDELAVKVEEANREKEVEEEVVKAWQHIHQPVKRKARYLID